MIGVYNYTVVLTYMSLVSACIGIAVSLSGAGHPYAGIFFLLFCGLLDSFDGKVARTKKNRTEAEKSFGIQIDSFSDLVAFGVLPASIGIACLRVSDFAESYSLFELNFEYWPIKLIFALVFIFYVLATMIRLAHFNVTEEIRQKTEDGARKRYTGLPVTSASIIFPSLMLLQYIVGFDLSFLYCPVLLIAGLCFLMKFTIPKPTMRGILIMVGFGVLECIALVLFLLFR